VTVDEAVKVLNNHKHDDNSKWYLDGKPGAPVHYVRGEGQYEAFSEFEAIAIAEKYQRLDAERDDEEGPVQG